MEVFLSMQNVTLAGIPVYINSILFLLLISVMITDLKSNSIYNSQTYTAAALGLILNFSGSGWPGLQMSLIGLAVGFALLFVFYLAGGFGAGDVKFLAAIGALKGTTFVIWTMVYAALVGGIMAMAVMIWKGVFWKTLKASFYYVCHPIRGHNELDNQEHVYLPYGVAIAIGCAWAFFVLL